MPTVIAMHKWWYYPFTTHVHSFTNLIQVCIKEKKSLYFQKLIQNWIPLILWVTPQIKLLSFFKSCSRLKLTIVSAVFNSSHPYVYSCSGAQEGNQCPCFVDRGGKTTPGLGRCSCGWPVRFVLVCGCYLLLRWVGCAIKRFGSPNPSPTATTTTNARRLTWRRRGAPRRRVRQGEDHHERARAPKSGRLRVDILPRETEVFTWEFINLV